MKKIINKIPYKNISWLLSIWLGVMMMYHSYETLFFGGLSNFAGYLESMGIPFPKVMSPIAKMGEFFGGLAVLIGTMQLQRIGLVFIICVMAVATFVAHKGLVWSDAQLSFTFLLIAIVLFFNPAPSIFHLFFKKET